MGPTFEQSNVFGETLIEAIPQLSLLPLSMSAGVMEACPVESKNMVSFLLLATGAILSTTVTIAVQVEALPVLSLTVKVTVFGPILAQVNLFGLTLAEAIPQASLMLSVTLEAVTVTFPQLLKEAVKFLQLMIGAL